MTAIFITATGPDVGKTLVVAALIRHLRQLGHTVDAIKPIVSGYEPAQAAASDPGTLIAALGLPFSPESIERTSPWRYRAALSPDLAARLEGRSIDVDAVIAYCKEMIERRRDMLLIEGVGGIMEPLDQHRTVLDVMMALRLPLILVTGSYRGAPSHTLTALELAVPARHERARDYRQRNAGQQACAGRRGRFDLAFHRTGDRPAAPADLKPPLARSLSPGRARHGRVDRHCRGVVLSRAQGFERLPARLDAESGHRDRLDQQ